jgi:tol-pal system protein YbgF
LAALLLCGVISNAHAGLFEDDEARRAILDLRQRLDAVEKSDSQLRNSLLDLQSQLEMMRQELAQSRGRNEQLVRDVSEMQQRQRDVQTGLDERLRKFEPARVSVDGVEFLADPAEKKDFDAAMVIFRSGKFDQAQVALANFLQRYPQSGYGPSVLFWLGNAEYANNDYKSALTHFRQMLTASPNHTRAPEAMLAVSNVQLELKDVKGARKTLQDLMAAYPNTEAANVAKERQAKLK